MFYHVLLFKEEAKNFINKIVEYNLYLLAHKEYGFDSYVVLKNLLQWRTVVNLIKNGPGILSTKIFTGYVHQNEKTSQYVHFRCDLMHIKDSLKNIGKSYILQPCLLKQELKHYDINEDTWEDKENEWLAYLKSDVLSTAFVCALYTMGMVKLTGFGMKYSSTLLSPAKVYFNSSRDENDEFIYTYINEFLRHFVRRSIKGGRSSVLNQYYTSTISDDVFNIISQELNVQDNICEIIDNYFEFTNKHGKIKKKEYDSQVKD